MTAREITGVVTTRVSASLRDADNRHSVALITFIYDPAAPLEVLMLIPSGGVDWTFARDLLADGVDRPAGLGDVQVWTTGALAHIQLQVDDETSLFSVPVAVLQRFLAATERRVPRGTEQVDVDAVLAELIGGAS